MNRSLFNLICKAGRVSLDELRARSPVEDSALSREIVAMIDEGVISLSPNPDTNFEQLEIEGHLKETDFLKDFFGYPEFKRRSANKSLGLFKYDPTPKVDDSSKGSPETAYARASGPPKCGVQNGNIEVRSLPV